MNPTQSLDALLDWRAENQPDLPAFAFMDSRLDIVDTDSYATLALAASRVAAALRAAGVAPGAPVILACAPGLDFVRAFYGILRAGAVALPTQPPTEKNAIARLEHVAAGSAATWGIATRATLATRDPALQPASLRWLTVEDCLAGPPDAGPSGNRPDAIAIHQYSSGTVGVPHGVRISHRNLLHNSELIRRAFVHTSKQRGLVWLPPYHDMGLIGGIVQPLYAGFRTTLMAPRTFLRSPLNWLRAITMTGATTSGGPNFAYESCLAASDDEIERANLDLSRWLVAFNGAETVNPATLRQFATRFRRFGFRMASFTSCYGLAEATLIVSASSHLHKPSLLDVDRNALAAGQIRLTTKADREHRRLVGLGTPLQAVRVIKQDGSEASPYDVGEIWVAGDSVAEPVGDEDSAFHAQLPDDPAQYVRTGDLGFVYKGELYVVGRSKAIVIVRGRNHHAEDMEASCRALEPALAQMGAAAFGDDEAGIAVVLEVPRRHPDMPGLLERVRGALAEQHGIAVDEVVLVRERSLARTPSGKIRRSAVAAAHRAGRLSPLSSWRAHCQETSRTRPPLPAMPALASLPRETALAQIRDWLAALLAAELNMQKADINPDTHFGVYGLDSFAAVNLAMHIGDQSRVDLEATLFWDYPNCTMLSEFLVDPARLGAAELADAALATGAEA